MANTGYITSSGIVQVFTSGPYSGSQVTSSYSDGSNLFGNIINTFQSFNSGTVDIIIPCETNNPIPGLNVFERFYYDPISCPPDNVCIPPTIISVERNTCNDFDPSIYNIVYISSSISASSTLIEYSLSSTFNITGSTILNNSNVTSSINVEINGFAPQASSVVYFRARNLCSTSSISNYSPIFISNNCEVIIPTYSTFTFNIVNETNYLVEVTNGDGNGVTGPWFNVPINNTSGNSYDFNSDFRNFFFKVAAPQNCPNQGIYIELSTTTPNIDGNVITNINSILDPNDCGGNGISIQVQNYIGGNQYYLHYPTNNINNQISTNIFINRANWLNVGNIKMIIKFLPQGGGGFIIN
jgi:hypothetical protein